MIYAMSDIHGCMDELKEKMKKVDLTENNRIVFLGDYMDYGDNSHQVLRYLKDLQDKNGVEKVIVLKENHEQMFLDWMSDYRNPYPDGTEDDMVFNDYDYHPEDKSITINEAEAETVRLIFNLYLQGYGAYRIAKELTRLGKVNKKGVVKWTDSGMRGIIKNEKYKGDLLMGKTYTVDPISKRRLDNRGESNKYYTKNHHEAIISEEEWNQAQEILKSRYRTNENVSETERIKFARKYAFSSMCKCGFCGTNLTRRSHHQDTQHKKPVWKCSVFLQ